MSRPEPRAVQRVACVGAGTIGGAWAALFLARGLDVVATDPGEGAEARMRDALERAWPALERLGLAPGASRERLGFTSDLGKALERAQFVQESAPDDEALKMTLVADIDAACAPEVVIASSSSRFLPSRIASRCAHPERVIVGHPFVPAYLVPLVEVVGGEDADPEVLDWAMGFYAQVGKKPLKLKREIEAYVANRLQAAVFKEALRLVEAGVCDYDDIDTAVVYGPGIRWAYSGPVLHRHLGGGVGGVRHMIDHLGWRGAPGGEAAFIDAVESRWGRWSMAELERWRDQNLLVMLEGLHHEPESR
jgi:3-hydroxyacyl-CoA dehydrogenase